MQPDYILYIQEKAGNTRVCLGVVSKSLIDAKQLSAPSIRLLSTIKLSRREVLENNLCLPTGCYKLGVIPAVKIPLA